MPKPVSPKIAQEINQLAVKFCNFFYANPEQAIQHAISALDNIARDYEGAYGAVRGMYTHHPEKLSTTRAVLSALREAYRLDQDNLSAARGAVGEIINFLKKSTNWSKGKQIPFTGAWLLYPSINNRFVVHVLTHAGVINTEGILEEAQDYFLTVLRAEADRRAAEEQAALQDLIARLSPSAAQVIADDATADPATVDPERETAESLSGAVQTGRRASSPWNDGTTTPQPLLRFSPTPPPAPSAPPATPDERDADSNIAVIFDMHRDERGRGLTRRHGFGFNDG